MPKPTVIVADFPAWEKGTRVTLGPCARRHRGQKDRRILGVVERGDYLFTLHATKGIRSQRVPSDGGRMADFIASIPPARPQVSRYATRIDQRAYLRGGNLKQES